LPYPAHPFKWGVRFLLLAGLLFACSPAAAPSQRLLPVESPRGASPAQPPGLKLGAARGFATPPRSDAELFSFHAGAALSVPPGVGRDGSVVVGTVDGYVHALRPDGGFRWSYTLNSRVASQPLLLDDGGVLVVSAAHQLFALREDGRLAWSRPLPAPASEIATDSQFHLHFRSVDGALVTISPRGGVVGFARAGRGPRLGPLAFEPTQAFLAEERGIVSRLGPFGRVKNLELPSGIRTFTRVGASIAVHTQSSLFVLNRELETVYRRDGVDRVVCGGEMLALLSRGTLEFVSESGALQGQLTPPFEIALAACAKRSAVALADDTGAIQWLVKERAPFELAAASSPVLGLDASRSGVVLAGFRDGRVTAYRAPE
jgi:outer membrane protein assembly factor BamB